MLFRFHSNKMGTLGFVDDESTHFVPSYKKSENGYLRDNGHDAMYRSDDTVTFYHAGGYYPFRSNYIKSKKSKQVHVYIGSVRGQNKLRIRSEGM